MTKVTLNSNANSLFYSSVQAFQKIDWKIKLCAGLVLGAAGLVTYQICKRRSFSLNTSPTFQKAQLNFSSERLSRIISFLQSTTDEKYEGPWTSETTAKYKPKIVNWNFVDVLSQTLKILDENDKSSLQQITLTPENHKKIFEFLNFGVGGKYEDMPDTQHESWVYKILEQLKKNHYIADFSISKDKITIDKIVK